MSNLVVERKAVEAALAEAGYPDADVRIDADDEITVHNYAAQNIPDKIVWKAFEVTGLASACWPCWIDGYVCGVEDNPACEGPPPRRTHGNP